MNDVTINRRFKGALSEIIWLSLVAVDSKFPASDLKSADTWGMISNKMKYI